MIHSSITMGAQLLLALMDIYISLLGMEVLPMMLLRGMWTIGTLQCRR